MGENLFNYVELVDNKLTIYKRVKEANYSVKEFLNSDEEFKSNLESNKISIETFYNLVVSNLDLKEGRFKIDELISNTYGEYLADIYVHTYVKYSIIKSAIKTFLFLMTSDIKTETFESIVAGKMKNAPTTFEDPNTGGRNQGVIVIDKTYDHEIIVDHPFGVKEHWRNQYRGRDKDVNPVHERILIHSFEKKGYHRKAKKEKLEKGV